MNIITLCNEIKDKKIINTKLNDHALENFLRTYLDVKAYVPFAEKRELCASVLEASCTKQNDIISVDSVSRYIIFTIAILTKYTNLEFNTDEESDSLDEYDLLCENGLLDPILDVIGSEYIKCNNLLNMMLKDIIDNNNTTTAVLSTFSQGVINKIGDVTDALANKIDSLNLDLNQIDIDKYKPLLDIFGGLEK